MIMVLMQMSLRRHCFEQPDTGTRVGKCLNDDVYLLWRGMSLLKRKSDRTHDRGVEIEK